MWLVLLKPRLQIRGLAKKPIQPQPLGFFLKIKAFILMAF